MSSNFSISIELVLVSTPECRRESYARASSDPVSFANCFKASASFLSDVLMFKSPLFN